MEDKTNGKMAEIYDLAGELVKTYKIAYYRIEPMASYIITRKVKNTSMVENTLDKIMDIPTDEAHELFLSLCKYYATVDEEAAKFYLNAWDEIYGEDESDTETSNKDKPKIRKKDYK